MSRRKKIFLGSISLHVFILLAVFIYPLLAMKKKPTEQSSINVKVNLDKLLSSPPKSPVPTKTAPPAPVEPKEEIKPEPPTPKKPNPQPKEPKPVDQKAIKERAQELKNEAIAKARKINAEREKVRDAKKQADAKKAADALAKKKAADKKKATNKKIADAKTKKERDAKLKRDKEAKAKKEREAKAARERWLAKEATRKANERAAAGQKTMKNTYINILAGDVKRRWENEFISNTEISQSDRVKIQITIRRDGYVTSCRIIQKARSTALNRAAQRFIAQLKKLPAFPKTLKDAEITETLNLGLQ
jgi:colicin import membrane protein